MTYKNYDYSKIKEEYNLKLKNKNQKNYIDFLDSKIIIFSNKKSFKGKDRKLWINRLKNSSILIDYFDDIIDDFINIKDVKKLLYSNSGKIAWELKRNEIVEKMKGRIPWNKGILGERNSFFGKTHTNETKLKISQKNKGKNNGMYGKNHSIKIKKNHSQKMKNMILEGKFTPNANNRNTHWNSTLDGIKYRSSWECLYKFYNPNSSYEKLRIKYNYKNEEKIYIVDFIDETNKLAIEVKPNNLLKQKMNKVKLLYLKKWCKNNDYSLVIVNEEWIIKNIKENFIDYKRFDKKTQGKIKKFYETNKKDRN